jgi:type III pantothenate kinase
MNLVIDIGNTSTKTALYESGVMLRKDRLASPDPSVLNSFIGAAPVDAAIVSTVSYDPSLLMAFLSGRTGRIHRLTWQSCFPFRIDYETPDTLGVDRLAAATGAFLHHPHAVMLVIDAGSALTIDLVAGDTFMGGSISPGMMMRFHALNEFTGRLPLITSVDSFSFPGRSTRDAVTAGVVMGLVFEINEYIRTLEERYNKIVTLITGGDSEIISSFCDREMLLSPDLVADGLNYLLDTNV